MSKVSTVHIGRHQIGRFRFLLWSLMMMIGLQPLLDEWIGVRIWADVFTDVFFGLCVDVRSSCHQRATQAAPAFLVSGRRHHTSERTFLRIENSSFQSASIGAESDFSHSNVIDDLDTYSKGR